MENVLSNKRCINFLKFVGYTPKYKLNNYIKEMIQTMSIKELRRAI